MSTNDRPPVQRLVKVTPRSLAPKNPLDSSNQKKGTFLLSKVFFTADSKLKREVPRTPKGGSRKLPSPLPASPATLEEAKDLSGNAAEIPAGPETTASDSQSWASTRKKRRKGLKNFFASKMPKKFSPLVWTLLLVMGMILSFLFLRIGENRGQQLAGKNPATKAKETETKGVVSMTPEARASLDAALEELRHGDAKSALKRLQEVKKSNPAVPSLSYLVSLAALQSGDVDLSEQMAVESIEKGERVADSLALQAVLEGQSGDSQHKIFGNSKARSEQLLRDAMMADSANPSPMIELAVLLRRQGRNEEAKKLLEGASARLQPVESSVVVEVGLELIKLQALSDEELPNLETPSSNTTGLFSDAYIALRKKDFAKAATSLKLCRERLPDSLFTYLINDPAFKDYAFEPMLLEFYKPESDDLANH